METAPLAPVVPPHVRPDQVVEFDIYHDPGLLADLHKGYLALQARAPEIFWTPLNGGHWMVTRFDLIEAVIRDPAHFSNHEIEIPKTESPFVAIPINLDPPEHTPYRVMLMRHFNPKVVAGLDESMRRWAATLIDGVKADGRCAFTETLGAGFPVTVFMELAGLPLDRFEDFRDIVTEFFDHIPRERRIELTAQIFDEMGKVIDARMAAPEDDLITRLTQETVGGRPLTRDELLSIMFLLFAAGLDTVANMLTFTFYHLARDPALQDRLRREPDAIPKFVDEALRRFPITNGVRLVKEDYEFAGTQLKAGDMIVAPMTLANLDDRRNPDPEAFDIDRTKRQHLTFSTGPHLCLGHYLARAEMRVFVETFLDRIPRFSLAPGFEPQFRAGVVMALENLEISWPVEPAARAA